jgi:ATP-dependent Lhr-like helicase
VPSGGVGVPSGGAAAQPTSTATPAHMMAQAGSTAGADPVLARAHHGSVSKDQRALIEDDLKSGRLRCVVATSSLELGIDMGAVDLVVQVESPPSVASGLQRVGRAGHQVGEISQGVLFPKHRADLVHTAITVERMLAGKIERLSVPANPLDILAQQTVAATALGAIDVEDWFNTVRRSAPFASLPRSAFEATLDLLAGRYPSDEFAELRPRVIWDRNAGTIEGRPGAQRLAVTSGGTIPDRGLFGVYIIGTEVEGTGGGGSSGGASADGRAASPAAASAPPAGRSRTSRTTVSWSRRRSASPASSPSGRATPWAGRWTWAAPSARSCANWRRPTSGRPPSGARPADWTITPRTT